MSGVHGTEKADSGAEREVVDLPVALKNIEVQEAPGSTRQLPAAGEQKSVPGDIWREIVASHLGPCQPAAQQTGVGGLPFSVSKIAVAQTAVIHVVREGVDHAIGVAGHEGLAKTVAE